ncbi:unnamed protein product [Urochloa humidicola]
MAPKICIGIAGPSSVGKSALLKAILDNEFDLANDGDRRLTQTLEFAHAKIYQCSSSRTSASCYRSCSDLLDMEDYGCDTPGHAMERLSLSRRAGFVDCPGSQLFVPTILKGIMMADGVLILSQPTDGFRAAPTLEALAAANMMGRSIVVVQIIKGAADRNRREEHRKEIHRCMRQLKISPDVEVPIVKISASTALKGIGDVCRLMVGMVPVTQPRGEQASSSSTSDPGALMLIASSCVVDPVGPEEEYAVAVAAAAGDETMFVKIVGRVVQGVASVADEVEVRPGIMTTDDDGRLAYRPITLTVTSVVQPEEEGEGDGLVTLRASATIVNVDGNRRHLRLVRAVLGDGGEGGMEGHVLCLPVPGCLIPDVYNALQIDDVHLLPKMANPYTEQVYEPLPEVEVEEKLLLIIGTMSTYGTVKKVSGRKGRTILVAGLSPPTCARYQESILICRKFTLSWHLIGSGKIIGGKALPMLGPPPAW